MKKYRYRKKWHLREGFLGASLLDHFKLYKHSYKKSRYLPGFYTDVDYVPPLIFFNGFKRK